MTVNSFFSIYLFYFHFIIGHYSVFRGSTCKNRGSMDPVHERGSMDPVHILMDPVHGPGPQRGSLDHGAMFCTLPTSWAHQGYSAVSTGVTG